MHRRLADRVIQMPRTGMRRFFELALNHRDVVSLGIGEPDFVTPEPIREAAIASLRRGETGYTILSGIPELRAAVARHLERLYGVAYDPAKEILLTVGTSQGLHASLTVLLNPGDEVLVPQPNYLCYVPTISLAGGTPVAVPVRAENRFQVAAAAVESAITPQTKAIVLNYPNNPTGAVLERAVAEELAGVVRRHDLLLLSDEVYDRLTYGVEHVCLAGLDGMQERTLLLGGFSKAYAMTGWRLGYVAGHAELIEALIRVHQYMVMCPPVTAQRAALCALESGESNLEKMRLEFDRRRRQLHEGLLRLGLDCVEPRGAFYAFPSVKSTGLSGVEFAERLVEEERVVVIPGQIFGQGGGDFVRCSFSVSSSVISEALERMGRFLARLRNGSPGSSPSRAGEPGS
jgi:aminotransferase